MNEIRPVRNIRTEKCTYFKFHLSLANLASASVCLGASVAGTGWLRQQQEEDGGQSKSKSGLQMGVPMLCSLRAAGRGFLLACLLLLGLGIITRKTSGTVLEH